MNKLIDIQKSKSDIWQLINELFPIHRTLVNTGFKKSLDIIEKQLPLHVLEYESGTQVYDWVIPNNYDVKQAYIKNSKGETIVDFKNNNLHLAAYSTPFCGKISKSELLTHLNFREDLPDAIPYCFNYYKNNWNFNVTFNQLQLFTDTEYEVCIDVDNTKGKLRIGEVYLPGESKQEIMFSTYLCHPSMANDNLSGVVTSVELFKYLSKIPNRKYSYRLVILPETVGCISYLANNEHILENIIGGYVVFCCGDKGGINYKQSYQGNSLTDQIATYVLKCYRNSNHVHNWFPSGSDERQYNAPGIRKPFGAINRTPATQFKEYHTSLDNLEFVTADALWDTVDFLLKIVQTLEYNITFKNNYKGEPCFSRHAIKYPTFSDALASKQNSNYYIKILTSEVDGTSSLFDIAKKWNIPIESLYDLAVELKKENLLL